VTTYDHGMSYTAHLQTLLAEALSHLDPQRHQVEGRWRDKQTLIDEIAQTIRWPADQLVPPGLIVDDDVTSATYGLDLYDIHSNPQLMAELGETLRPDL